MQRMGGINSICLSKDENYVLSVGQEKKLNYWSNSNSHLDSNNATHSIELDGEEDEGRCIAMYVHISIYYSIFRGHIYIIVRQIV